MRRVIVLLSVLAFAVTACDGEVELITVPDLSGMRLPDVRESFESLDLELEEIDGSGQDRAVFSPGNWSVEGQEPEPGAEVEPGGLVLISLANDRDQEPEPEPEAADEPESESEPEPEGEPESESEPEPEPEEEPEPEDGSEPEPEEEPEPEGESTTDLEANVSQNPVGLQFVTDADYAECRVNLNSGIIRSGYTRDVTNVAAGSPVIIPWGELTNSAGERFDYARVRPEMVTIDCDAPDGGWAVGTWNW